MKNYLSYKLVTLFSVVVIIACQSTGPQRTTRSAAELYTTAHLPASTPSPKQGIKIAIASGGKHASEAGLTIFRKGGNAVDVAVAVSFCLAVERPHSLGLGGGGLATLHLTHAKEKDFFVDFRESAPKKSTRTMYLDKDGAVVPRLSEIGALAVATPGFVPGMKELHKRWGSLPWRDVIAPAIQLAREGFAVYPALADRITSEMETLKRQPYATSLLTAGGKALKAGDMLVQADLAKTLELIAEKGPSEFSTGAFAKKLSAFIRTQSGILSADDLKNYKVIDRKPLKTSIFGHEIVSAPPPSAGGPLIVEWANVLAGYDRAWLLEDGTRYLHVLTETMKRGYADRSQYIGDPDFTHEPWEKLLTQPYADQIRRGISVTEATPSNQIKPGSGFHETPGTSHLSVLDDLGNAVAITLSINGPFGSHLAVPGTGVFLNNTMDDFSARPGIANIYGLVGGDANAIGPGKRPVSSTMPTIVLEKGEPIMAIGGAGGSRITSSVAQVVFNFLLLYPNDLIKSQNSPRIHHQWLPDKLDLESKGFDNDTTANLAQLGHPVGPAPAVAKVQAVSRNPTSRVLQAVADPRDDGAGAAAE